VCPFSVFDGAGKTYLCPRQGSGCRMHHPLLEELTWYRGRAYLNGAHYKTTGRSSDYYRSVECRCRDEDDTVCDATTVCILHSKSRSTVSSSRTSTGKPVFKNKFIQYPKGVSDSREEDTRSETSLSSCSTRCVSIQAAPVLATNVAVQKTNAWEKPLVGICIEKTAPPIMTETSALPSEAKRVSAWEKSPSSLFDSPQPVSQPIQPEAVMQKPVSSVSYKSNVSKDMPAMELCQNCFFYGQCNRNPSRLHLQDCGFPAAAKAFEKTFAETKVCLKGFFEPEKCKFGSACHRLHKGDARLTAGVIAAFRSFYIRTTAELSGRPLSTCRVNRSHDIRFCYFLHKEDSCGGFKANNACKHPQVPAKKSCKVASTKAVAAMQSQFAVLDEDSDTDEKESSVIQDPRPLPPTTVSTIRVPSCIAASRPLATIRNKNGVNKALSTSWAALADSDDEDD
jgi:hypothetical protein